ncbi:MAG: LrgB family protein [Rhodocyclaceae bacterium]
MTPRLTEVWVYLSASPLMWLAATLVAYQLAVAVSRSVRGHPLANPVAMAVALIVAVLTLTGTPYRTYFDGAQFVHFLLGPATVALAIPLYAQLPRLKEMAWPLAGALLAGSATAAVSAMAVAHWLGGERTTVLSLAPKSVTAPIAMGVAERIGGLPSLTAVLVVTTGIIGAVLGPTLLKLLRTDEDAVTGFAIGVAAHGIGTARAFQISETAGAFAGLAMGLNGIITALLLPYALQLFAAH